MSASDMSDESMICEINVTPLVDISLVLVIIFMVIAPFFSHLLKPIVLPQAAKASLNDQNTVKISMFEDGTLAVNTNIVTEADLGGAILKEVVKAKSPWALVRAEYTIPHGRVMQIVKLVKKSGIERIAFATRPTDSGGAQ